MTSNLNHGQVGFLSVSSERSKALVKKCPISDVYDVEERPFARGKFATVRKCCHKCTGHEYAAKFIRKRRRAMDIRHEILHEMAILDLSSNCQNIVHLREVYETPTELVLVLELASGGELQRLLDEEEAIAESDVIRFMVQILRGVSFLHQHNIAHLDLKPQNLLLTSAYPNCDVKLCDFGISRVITKGVEIRVIMGTPDYTAPEVLNYEPLSLSTDMWSIGVLTYVLLTGHSPFGGDTKQETFCNISQAQLDFPDDLFLDVSHVAKDFMRRLLVKEPSGRMTVQESLQHPWLQPCETLPYNHHTPILQKPLLTPDSETNHVTSGLPEEAGHSSSSRLSITLGAAAGAAGASRNPESVIKPESVKSVSSPKLDRLELAPTSSSSSLSTNCQSTKSSSAASSEACEKNSVRSVSELYLRKPLKLSHGPFIDEGVVC